MSGNPFRAIVIGGSVGGLAAALEFRRSARAAVAVYERSAGQMKARGAGVVMQPDVARLLGEHGTKAESICVRLLARVHLDRDGQASRQHAPQLMTAWDTLYGALRRPLQDVCYRQDSELVELSQYGGTVRVRFADGHEASSDFLVAADGVNSDCRTILIGKTSPAFAGYVAWRGLESERDLPAALVRHLEGRFTLYVANGMQMLCYLVPGVDGGTGEGERRVNWVWYVNTAEPSLAALLTGESGRAYQSFVPRGDVSREVEVQVRAQASVHLPTVFNELVAHSTLFLQPVQDVAGQPRMHGHCALVGDAAGTVRPHTASGTSKAFADATSLGMALSGWSAGQSLPDARLRSWEQQRQGDLARLSAMGMRLAETSGLGVGNTSRVQGKDAHEA